MKILMAAPFEPNGRYKGGISSLVNKMLEEEQIIKNNCIEITQFNTCRVHKSNVGEGQFSYQNIKNFLVCYGDTVKGIKKNRFDVLYYHSSVRFALLKDLLILNHAKKKCGIKTIVHIHMAESKRILTGRGIVDRMMLKLLKTCDGVVFLSEKTMEEFIALGLDRSKCKVIYNFSTLSYTEEEILSKKYSNKLLFVGSICERKGIFDLLEALTRTEKEYSLTVCGGFINSESEAKFKEYLERMGGNVRFLGYVENEEKHRVFLDTDVLVLPSFAEGLPVVILEAFSAGNAVVSTDVGAIGEIVTDSNGRIVPPGNSESLKKILEDEYLNGTNERVQKIKMTNYVYSKEFTVERFVEKIAEACSECMENK